MYDRGAKMIAALSVIILLIGSPLFVVQTGGGTGYHTKEKEFAYTYEESVFCLQETTSEPRIIEGKQLVKKRLAGITASDYEILCRIVQAEAGGEDLLGQQMVADVIINRVNSPKFPNSVEAVVFQGSEGKAQFSPIRDGRYYTVTVSEQTRKAVDNALEGEDNTNGALYFVNASKADPSNLTWFENCLSFRVEHGGHRFYK
nr:cell wall hydrolase [Lachnospiraceae bacterium]